MTKEQAIEILEGLKKSNEACIKSSKIEDTPFTTIWKRQNEAIETVLSMLEEKDKQIDKLKKHNDELLRKLRNRVKEVKKLEKYSLYKEEFSRLNKQLQNKDKQIDLMSEHLARLTIFDVDKDEPLILGDKDDVKQYFENKAKEVKI